MKLDLAAGIRRIGWVLLSPPEDAQPSTRIAALQMMGELPVLGFASSILYAPEQSRERPQLPPLAELMQRVRQEQFEVIVFQKVYGESVLAFIDALRAEGIKTVYMVCDLILPEMTQATDMTLVVSPYLRSLYPAALQDKIKVVHDGIERGDLFKIDYSEHRGSRRTPLNAVLVTSSTLHDLGPIGLPPAWLRTHVVGRYTTRSSVLASLKTIFRTLAELQDMSSRLKYLRFTSHLGIQTKAWSEAQAYESLLAADIGIIPVAADAAQQLGELPPMWMRKSENRLTMKMSLGLPVIASPVPAYLDVIEQGVTGFIAHSPADWRRYLAELRDPALRRSMGSKARQAVIHRYSRAQQAERLADALRLLWGPSAQ